METTRPQITIRPAQVSDVETLTDLAFRSKQSNGYDDAFMAACRDELRITSSTLSERAYWVAEADSVLGCAAICASESDGTGEVHAFFVAPEAKRRGVGRALWNRITAAAVAEGWRRLLLDADPAAVRFYEAMGFRVVGQSPSGSIPGRMIPLMAIDLSAQAQQ